MNTLIGLLFLAWVCPLAAAAAAAPANLFQRVGFDQHLGAHLPMEARLRDTQGNTWALAHYFQTQRPVVLVLGYYGCPNLCGVQWRGFLEAAQDLQLEVGRDYDVVAVSIDPRESPALARQQRQSMIRAYGRGTDAGWHFLTGSETAVRRVAQAAGFRYVYDEQIDQYAHAAGLVVSTSDGRIARYLFGVRFDVTDLRLALVEASGGRIGSPVDRLLLLCYHYDPANGRYGLLIMNVLRGAGLVTVGALLGFVIVSRRREARRHHTRRPTP